MNPLMSLRLDHNRDRLATRDNQARSESFFAERFIGKQLGNNQEAHPLFYCTVLSNDSNMQFHKQAFLLLAALSVSTTGFVIPSGRGSAFGLCTRSFSAVFSEATDDAAPAVEVAIDAPSEVVVTPADGEKFTIYVSNVPFGTCCHYN